MKKILILFLLVTSICLSQSSSSTFKAGVEIAEVFTSEKLSKPKSILFEFSGDSHLINHYLNLTKYIKKAYRKSGIKTRFNYNLIEHENSFTSDIKSIPKRKYNTNKFDFVCKYEFKNFKGWDNHLIKNRKQYHSVVFSLLKEEELLLKVKLDVKTFYTISTQNENVSQALVDLINKNLNE